MRRIISWLPTAHVMDRVLHYSLALAEGFETTTCPDPREIARYLTAVRPHLLIAVPRVWEKLKAGVEAALAAQPAERRDAAERGDRRRRSSACACARPAPPVPPDLEAGASRAPTPRCSPACASGSGSTS